MATFKDFKSYGKDIIVDVLEEYSTGREIPCKKISLDVINIANLIENYIYKNVETFYEDGSLESKYTLYYENKEGMYEEWYRGADNSIGDRGQKMVEC